MSDQLGKSFQHSMNQKFGRGTYQVLQPIKRGADGYVYKIQYIREKRLGALKVLPRCNVIFDTQQPPELRRKHKPDTTLESKAINEIKIHESIRSNYVVKLHNTFKDQTNYFMFLEYVAKGDLADEISRHPQGLAIGRIRKIGLQLAKGIDTIHRKSIVHRDIKPRNILISEDDEIKICDFSCAKMVNGQKSDRRGAVGTLQYMAPETLGKHDFSVDIWSFGIVMYVMATGHTPFKLQKSEIGEYLAKINKESISELSAQLDKHICVDKRAAKQQQNKGLTCKCASLNHEECYHKLIEMLRRILVFNVESRCKIDEIINHPFFTGEHLPILENNSIKQQQYDEREVTSKMRPKASYSLEHIKKSLNYAQHTQGSKMAKTTQDILDRHRQKYNPNNTHTALYNRNAHDEGQTIREKPKQERIKINSRVRENNENINTMNTNEQGEKQSRNTIDADDLIRHKLNSNYNSQAGKENKYISDSNPSFNHHSPKQEPLNCTGLNCCKWLPSEKLTINEQGLKAEFNNSDKSLMISPRGKHITLTYEGKSKYYELDRLPEKYMSLYNYYRVVVDSLKSQACLKDSKKRSQCQLETEGQRRSQKTSRDKEDKQSRTDRPNSTNKLEKPKQKYSHPAESLPSHIKSQININLTLMLSGISKIQSQSYLSTISFSLSSEYTKQLEISLMKVEASTSKISQKLNLAQFAPSESKLKYVLMKLAAKLVCEGSKKDPEFLMGRIQEANQVTIRKWGQSVGKFCAWIALMPNYHKVNAGEKKELKIESKQAQKKGARQFPKSLHQGYLAEKEKLYNITANTDNQSKHYNHRILLDNFTSKR